MKYIYTELKQNNVIVKLCLGITFLSVVSALGFAYYVNRDSNKIIYAINDRGIIVPLNRLTDKTDKIKIVKSAMAYFVEQYYSLDQFNVNERIEKVLWLADNTFKEQVIEDKKRKGYYNRFLQSGIIQKGRIDEQSIKISSYDQPYKVTYDVLIEVSNLGKSEYYKITNSATLLDVNLNYPYNPFGLLYTNFLESNIVPVEKPAE